MWGSSTVRAEPFPSLHGGWSHQSKKLPHVSQKQANMGHHRTSSRQARFLALVGPDYRATATGAGIEISIFVTGLVAHICFCCRCGAVRLLEQNPSQASTADVATSPRNYPMLAKSRRTWGTIELQHGAPSNSIEARQRLPHLPSLITGPKPRRPELESRCRFWLPGQAARAAFRIGSYCPQPARQIVRDERISEPRG